MGVTGLWPMLSELCERKPLSYLAGKKLAVDLSGWIVQATQCKGLNTSRNPHLRNLFFRVSRLLQSEVHPIFVIEGKLPAVKEAAFKERHHTNQEGKQYDSGTVSRKCFEKILDQCEDLLKCLGVPCIKSSGEAEALCAFLCLKGVVDGVITEDNDAFLYGADVVFRDFSIDPNDPHVNVYDLKSTKNKLHLDRVKLIALALLLGCDYTKGVPGVGKDTAVKLLSELGDVDILQRFKDWKSLTEAELFPGYENKPVKKATHCNRCGHIGSSTEHKKEGCAMCDSKFTCYLPEEDKLCTCAWHKSKRAELKWKTELKIYNIVKSQPNFPNAEVIEEYLNYTDILPEEEMLEWVCPNLIDFQDKAFSCFGWTIDNSQDKCMPIITSWQQFRLSQSEKTDINLLYEPIKILKNRTIRGEEYLEVQWKLCDDERDCSVLPKDICTTEPAERFCNCYPEISDNFFGEITQTKEKSESQPKVVDQAGENRKITEFLVRNCTDSLVNESLESTESKKRNLQFPESSPKKFCSS